MINNFSGEFEFLSNFYMMPVWFEGIWYPSSEHAYQAAKTDFLKERMSIFECKTAGKAKRMGNNRKLTHLRTGWNEVRIPTMTTVLISKFKNKEIGQKLLDTFPQQLIEGNIWHDNFWGDCRCDKCKKFQGRNNLGFILTLVRSNLKTGLGVDLNKINKKQWRYDERFLCY